MTTRVSAFVALPFGERFERVYREGLLPIESRLPGTSVCLLRADTAAPTEDLLWLHITTLINNSDFVIADLTGQNPNVMLELGYALARNRIPIIITQDSNVPSNVAGHIRVRYSESAFGELQRALIGRISAKLPDIVSASGRVLSVGGGRTYWWKEAPEKHRPEIPKKATALRERGDDAKMKEDLEAARSHYANAIEEAGGAYREAKYDLALVLSRLRDEASAQALASEVVKEAMEARDYLYAFKAHNLLSGIHLRAGQDNDALAEIRLAYEISHYPELTGTEPPHIIPIKNRIPLEWRCGDRSMAAQLIRELKAHPKFAAIQEEVEPDLRKLEDEGLGDDHEE